MNYAAVRKSISVMTLVLCSTVSFAFDNAHFYRATYLGPEPRLEYPWLATYEVSLGGGWTSCSLDCSSCGTRVPLLDLYGTYNMQFLGKGVPNKDMSNLQDLTLLLLESLPSRSTFGQMSVSGFFSMTEATLMLAQNLNYGFFLQFYAPLRSLSVKNIRFIDLSPNDNIFPNINTPQWQTFLNQFDAIMARYNISTGPTKSTGIGDISLLVGWTINYEGTCWFDYIDATLKTGVLLPTGKVKNPNQAFSISLGYDGFLGLPISAAASVGLYEWLTMGGYFEGIFFGSRLDCARFKTAFEQSGLIELASGTANLKGGTVWLTGGYLKADHFCHGLSLLIGYSYAQRNRSFANPSDTVCFNPLIVNSDAALAGWNRSTLNLLAEFDLTQECSNWGVRLGLFYNQALGGRRVFKTSFGGAYSGLDIAFQY